MRSSAHWTAGKLKSGVERIGSFSGEQGSKHKYGFGLAILAIIGFAFVAGATFLLTTPVSNPKASDATYTRAYTSNGTVVLDNQKITGILKCVVQPTMSAATEVTSWTLVGGLQRSFLGPYWITAMQLNIYSGGAATGTPIQTVPLIVDSTTYTSVMLAWVNAYFTTITSNPTDRSKWVLGATPSNNPTWTVNFDTRNLANGIYTFQAAVTWNIGAAIPDSIVTGSGHAPLDRFPPSLTSSSGNAYFLSLFGIGGDVPLPPIEVTLPVMFIGLLVVAVTIVVIIKRR